VGGGVGDQLGEADQQGVDDAKAGGAQRPSRLGQLDHGVDDVRHLGLCGPVGKPHVGVDTQLLEVPPGQLGVLGGDPDAGRQFAGVLDRRVLGHG
jgi:hypothetical protein